MHGKIYSTDSIIVAIPIPRPIHWVANAYFLFSLLNSWAAFPVSLAPVAPSGCPKASAPPSILTLLGSIFKSFMQASDWDAKASLSSTISISFIVNFALSNAFWEAPIGPRPIVSALHPCTEVETILAKISKLLSLAYCSSQINVAEAPSVRGDDVAAVTLVCEEQYAKDNNLEILGRIVSTAVEGCDPDYMGLGPIEASRKALKRANLSIKDIDIIELNEAFASQSLACIKDLEIDINKVNLDGGAISLGHPLGATGARITGKAAELLGRENKKYALATQCIGYGMGIATIIESVN